MHGKTLKLTTEVSWLS